MAFLTIVVELPEGEDEKKFMEMLKQNTDEKGLIAGACLESYCIGPLDPIGLLSVLAEGSISENMDRLIAKEEGAEEAEAEKSPLIVPSQSILLH